MKYLSLDIKKFDDDTRDLSLTEIGAVHKIMMYACRHDGKVPANENDIRRIVGTTPVVWKSIREAVLNLFENGRNLHVDHSLRRHQQFISAGNASKYAKSLKTQESNTNVVPINVGSAAQRNIVSSKKVSSTEYADRPSIATATSLEERVFPAAPERPPKEYFYENRFIKLNEKDFKRWEKAFPDLNLMAELETFIFWDRLTEKNWFHVVPQALKKKNEELKKAGGIKWY